MATLARAIAPSYLRLGGTFSDMQLFNETLNGPQIQQFPQCLNTGVFGREGLHGNYCQIFTGEYFSWKKLCTHWDKFWKGFEVMGLPSRGKFKSYGKTTASESE
jgi:hypothetical protein